MKKSFTFLIIILSCLNVFSQNDVSGSKDHPAISRFKGSWIRYYEFDKFNQYNLRITSIKKGEENTARNLPLEGAVTRIVYQCPKTVSAFEVYKSYESALKTQGFETIFSCETANCGAAFGSSYPNDNAPHIRSYSQDQRYFAGKRKESDSTELYVAVYSVFTQDGPVVRLDVIEIKRMEEGQVFVSAAKINSDMAQIGKSVINQILFESGNANILPESSSAIQEIATYLKNNPFVKIYIVGHTDNVGTLDFNLNLSQQRADAVVQELVKKHGIDSNRLFGKGVGFLCPIASNESDKGKALNRRVELIKQ